MTNKSAYYYIKSAFTKIQNASLKRKGCHLSFEECMAICNSHEITGAIGSYDNWEFDDNGKLLTYI